MQSELIARAEPGFQRRSYAVGELEIRANEADTEWTLEGVGCTVDHAYTVRDRFGEFTETIAEGAFDRTLANDNARIALYANHNWRFGATPMATRRAGTLELVADPHLRVRATLDPSRPDVQVMRSAIKRGEMTEMSIGFNDTKNGRQWNDEFTASVVTEAALREVSVVEEGANDATTASIRSLLVDVTRARAVDYDEAELRRAIAHLESLLPTDEVEEARAQIEPVLEHTGVLVTDELIELFAKRHNFAA